MDRSTGADQGGDRTETLPDVARKKLKSTETVWRYFWELPPALQCYNMGVGTKTVTDSSFTETGTSSIKKSIGRLV
jgi:hypothetical protein